MKTRFALIVSIALLGPACTESPTEPTSPTETTPTITTLLFSGTLAASGSRFYSFTASRDGTASATLASVTAGPRAAAADVPIGLGIGRPAGVGCSTITSVNTVAALTTQLQHGVEQGVYCVTVYDPGALAGPVNFVVRFSFP